MRYRWEGTVFARDPEMFPELDPNLFGEPMKRMKVEIKNGDTSLIPEDVKALKKEWKMKMKSKK